MFATLLAFAMVASVGMAAGVGGSAATSAASPHDNGVGANYTVSLPNEQDHYPGEQGGQASINHLAAAGDGFQDAKGFRVLEFIVLSSQEVDFSACTTDNTRAFGVDRGNDNPGTQTDDPLLQHREDSAFKPNKIVVDFFDEDSIAGESTYLNRTDQVVAVQDSCYKMPQEPGWYQLSARVNGTTYSGNHLDIKNIKSHYFYICECSNEQEARQQLGPPPSESGGGNGGGGGGGGSTPTASPTSGGGNGGGGADTGNQTGTSTGGGGADVGNQTETGTETTGNETGNQTTADATDTEADDAAGGTPSPTDDGGPGFGIAAAVLALFGAAFLALRER